MDNTKHCPYCDEIIKANAVKCKHCGSTLVDYASPSGEASSLAEIKMALAHKYEIIGEIGRGGMASVYKAVQKNLNRMVALKVIHKNLLHFKEFLERFHREALLSTSLNHPNIVTIFDQGAENGIHYISMEYIEGMDLHRIIHDSGGLKIDETINIIAPIAEALDYAHNKGIVHRDIKSSNIIVTKNGRALLTDFGIAHAVTATKLTQSGMIIGTPDYMSPEQAISGKTDAQSDLYSLGVVLYECITGDLPFKGETPVSTIFKIINDKIEPISKTVPTTPGWLSSIVNKVLAKNKNNRFKTGNEFSKALRAKQKQTDNFDLDETIKVTTKEIEGIKQKFHPSRKQKTFFFSALLAALITGFILFNNGKIPFISGRGEQSLNELDRKKLDFLTYEGDHFFETGNYYKPSEANAAEKYLEVLKIYPDDNHAKGQLDKIEEEIDKDINNLNASNKIEDAKKLLIIAQQYFPSNNTYQDKLNKIKIKELEINAEELLNKDPLKAYDICKEIKTLDAENEYIVSAIPEIKNNLTKRGDFEYERENYKKALDNYKQVQELFGSDTYISRMISTCISNIEESHNIKVPNLIGFSLNEAKKIITQYGLITGNVSEIISSNKNKGIVFNQVPKSGTKSKKGDKVNLFIGK